MSNPKPIKPLINTHLQVGDDTAQALENRDRNLPKLATEIKALHLRAKKKTVNLVYDLVAIGLRLLKAKEVHQSDHLTRFGAKKNAGGDTVSTPEAEGYHKWLEKEFPDLHERAAQRYVNSALNAGLTAGSPLSAIDKIRKEKLLHEKQLTDLYRPPRQLTNGLEQEPAPESAPNAVRDTLREFGSLCDSVVQLRDQMSPKEYEAAIDRLKDTLKLLTDCDWEMVGCNVTLPPAEQAAPRRAKRGGIHAL